MNLKKILNEMKKRPPHFISELNRFKNGNKLKQNHLEVKKIKKWLKIKRPRLWGPFEKS